MTDTIEHPKPRPVLYKLFPVCIHRGQLAIPQVDLILKYASVAPEAGPLKSVTTDAVGDSYYHLLPDFKPLFDQIRDNAYSYLKAQNHDISKLDLYVTKSWIVDFARADNTVHRHNHPYSDLSIVYYADISDSPIWFGSGDPLHRQMIQPDKNDLLIFPSLTEHWVERGADSKRRISFSADLIMVLKKDIPSEELLRNPIETWKRM